MRTMQLRRPGGAATPKDLGLLKGTGLGQQGAEPTGSGLSDLRGQFGAYPVRFPVRLSGRSHDLLGRSLHGRGR